MFDFTNILIVFVLITIIISFVVIRIYNKKTTHSKDGYITADRSLGKFEASLSIAASWIWAPSLFISAQKSFQDGIIGLFWFVVPNILCLILFAFFAKKVRNEMPQGFTLSAYIKQNTSHRVQALYWFTLIGLAVCAFAVQLLAGGQILSKYTGISYLLCTLIIAFVPLSYSLFSGLKASIITDVIKMIFIYLIGIALIFTIINASGGFGIVVAGLGGKIKNADFFSEGSLHIFLTFGLPTTIGLLAGPFGDQTFWQRAFSIKKDHVKASYINAAFLFALVPLMMSILGFIAAGNNLHIGDPQMVNIEVVTHYLPTVGILFFIIMIMMALISTLDSKLSAIASLGAHDFINHFFKNKNITYDHIIRSSRFSMLALTVAAIMLANIPGLKILHLFLFYGTLRSSTVIPTILIILKRPIAESGIFWGILASIFIGLPLFTYGNINKIAPLIVLGSLLTVSLSGIISNYWPKKELRH